MKISAVLFDLDGTLVNTEPSAVSAVVRCFQEWGLHFPIERSESVKGRTWRSLFDEFKQSFEIPVTVEEAVRAATKHYLTILEEELVIIPGSQLAIRSLAKYWPLGLVTGSTREEIKFVGRRLKVLDHFSVILGAEDYVRSKPAPDGFLLAAEFIQADPSEVLVFEDSVPGIAAALAAGMQVIAVGAANHVRHDGLNILRVIPDMQIVDASFITSLDQSVPAPRDVTRLNQGS